MASIEFRNVTKTFPHVAGRTLLRTHLVRWFGRQYEEVFTALKNVSFHMTPGESLAVVGRNGAGKSTLLSLVAGLSEPNSGSVKVHGRVAALLELGSGFHPDLTGAENVVLNASLLGLSKKRTMELFDSIVDFSGIAEFINDPLRTYSSGMGLRLAFSVAINTQPDILLLDEVLAVGDAAFQAKCLEALRAFRNAGGTMLFVSHSAGAVKMMCDRALWIDAGEVVMDGAAGAVLDAYEGVAVPKPGA